MLAAVSSAPPALLLLAVVGVAGAIVDVSVLTILHWLVPEEVMGRVFTSFESILTLAVAAGSIAASGLIAAVGLRGALIVTGLIAPTSVVLAVPRLRRIDAEHQVAAEIAALTASKRTATVRACTALGLLRIRGPHFVRAVTGYAPSSAAADTLVEARLAHASSSAGAASPAPAGLIAEWAQEKERTHD